jgi:hypothetical protein
MSQTKKIHNNEQVHHHRRDHEDQSQHVDHHVTIVQPNMKKIQIINPYIKYNVFFFVKDYKSNKYLQHSESNVQVAHTPSPHVEELVLG